MTHVVPTKMEAHDTPYGKDTKLRVSEKKPKDNDYLLTGIEIDGAANGIIVTCRYTIKPEAKKVLRAKENYCDTYREPTKHVFEGYDGVVEFITKELNKLGVDAKKVA